MSSLTTETTQSHLSLCGDESGENVSDKTIILFLKQTRRIEREGLLLNGSAKVKLAITPGKMRASWLHLR